MALKFLGADGSGSVSDAIEAIHYAADNGARISNNSWGFADGFSQALYDAIEAVAAQGHIVMAAAGNGNFIGIGQNNDVTPFYPGSYDLDNIVTVAALDHNDARAVFSNYGAHSVDLGAPGVNILSTTRNNTYAAMSGTSMATPQVSGVAALVQDFHPEWSYSQLIDQLLTTTDPVAALQGITTTGGRVNALSALVPDTFGPQVVAVDPARAVKDPVSSLRVTFDETIDAESFTMEDIAEFTGPNGAVAVASVSPVPSSLDRTFEVRFPAQADTGQYQLILGPYILDHNGNAMDQDNDGVNGEPVEDRCTAVFTIVPVLEQFDFGRADSPVETGFTGVSSTTGYSSELGYGFQAGTVSSVDRGSGSALERDLVYGRAFTFAVDLPNGVYRVTLWTGDFYNIAHEQMGVYLEGEQVGVIDTAGLQVLETVYEGVRVNDGQLTLRMADLGGSDVNAVLNGLIIEWAGEEQDGPHVLELTRNGEVTQPLDRLQFTFNEAIDALTFTLADVASLTGPQGAIAPLSLTALSETRFELAFAEQTAAGSYEVVIGPDIQDASGNWMDQDQDGDAGEALEDRFTGAVTLVPVADRRFDFGRVDSPVEPGFMGVSSTTGYSIALGYGFQSGAVSSVDRGSGSALERDLVYGRDFTFAVDLPNAVYRVTLWTGDFYNIAHEQMGVYLEGEQAGVIDTAGLQVLETVYEGVRVNDGQLTLRMADLGGSDVNAVLNGLLVQWTAAEQDGPHVLELTRSGEATQPLDRLQFTFNEAMDASSFTLADVASLTGPQGAIAPLSLTALSEARFELAFAEQTAAGPYEVVIGPEIQDASGNWMDQDQDGDAGEALEDRFTGAVALVPVADRRFDFGRVDSPVEPGFMGVSSTTGYSIALGYGFQSGAVSSVDRGSGSALERDLVYGRDFTFAVDLPNAVYRVTLWTGDFYNIAHEQMGVYLEGDQVGVIATAGLQVLETVYEGVRVNDGQLTLRMADLGGSDVNAVLNGLIVEWVEAEQDGPQVVELARSGEATEPLDRLQFTFNEAMDASSFTLADVASLTGPQGAIAPLSLTALSEARFELAFAEQTAAGPYEVVIGPEIQDASGNWMDQDQDGDAGEALEDRFTGAVTLVPVADRRFDFGRSSSPVETGFTGVDPSIKYSIALGYGFQSGAVSSVDRGSGSALERDLVYGRNFTFGVDLPNAVYRVTLWTGDLYNIVHEQMGVYLEGEQVGVIDTAGRQVLETVYEGVRVNDGQLTLQMVDLGGRDVNAVLNGLVVQWVAATAGAASAASQASPTSAEFATRLDPATVMAVARSPTCSEPLANVTVAVDPGYTIASPTTIDPQKTATTEGFVSYRSSTRDARAADAALEDLSHWLMPTAYEELIDTLVAARS